MLVFFKVIDAVRIPWVFHKNSTYQRYQFYKATFSLTHKVVQLSKCTFVIELRLYNLSILWLNLRKVSFLRLRVTQKGWQLHPLFFPSPASGRCFRNRLAEVSLRIVHPSLPRKHITYLLLEMQVTHKASCALEIN